MWTVGGRSFESWLKEGFGTDSAEQSYRCHSWVFEAWNETNTFITRILELNASLPTAYNLILHNC
jgi:hypothetical protein